jgi:hypothetical protein
VPNGLEAPGSAQSPAWGDLYRSLGEEVVSHRPIFTGDVFEKATVFALSETKTKNVIVLQHPCALRTDGVNLHSRILVAEVRNHSVIEWDAWDGHLSKMPLPGLKPTVESGQRNQAAMFESLYFAGPESLVLEKRIACLSQLGVNLLLQRWVHHNSRAVIPTMVYQEVTSPVYEEADLIEEWCEQRAGPGLSIKDASMEAVEWLREVDANGVMRQELLRDPQTRSGVRRSMRAALKDLR